MAFIVMLSTFSFAIQKHYCGEILVDTTWFVKAKDCGMKSTDFVVEQGCPSTILKKSCCKDESQIFSGQDELKNSYDSSFEINPEVFLFKGYKYFNLTFFYALKNGRVLFKEYPPPENTPELYQLYQVYLI